MTALRHHSTTRATTAHPPLYAVPSMDEWRAQHHAPRRHWLARILAPTASPAAPAGAPATSAQAVEAGLGANPESRP